ncbi:MAG: hypothetical protein QXF76_04515 [Candidatus Anstonellales archaeon]
MGIQQLLLIGLSIIVVGITVYISYNLVIYYLQTSNREQLITQLNNLCIAAQQYYKKPKEQGGGGGSFAGWNIPQQFLKTEDGIFRAVVRDDKINFNAIGNHIGLDNKNEVCVDAVVNSKEIKIIVVN